MANVPEIFYDYGGVVLPRNNDLFEEGYFNSQAIRRDFTFSLAAPLIFVVWTRFEVRSTRLFLGNTTIFLFAHTIIISYSTAHWSQQCCCLDMFHRKLESESKIKKKNQLFWDLRYERGYFRSPGRGVNFWKIEIPFFPIGRTDMRRCALESPTLLDSQKIFFVSFG